jgi:hypothetical protein
MDNAITRPEIVIMTTCVDRPEIHTEVFNSYKSYIGDIDCKWIITINNLKNQVDETEKNIRDILKDYDLYITTFSTGGTFKDFYESVKYCMNLGYTYKPKQGYVWLEDDWVYEGKNTISDHLKLLTPMCNISLYNRDVISFNPSIWSPDLFEQCMLKYINNPISSNQYKRNPWHPERIACSPEGNSLVKKKYRIQGFKDIGRDWQNKTIKTFTFKVNQ